jgi:hypothetical protein
LLFEVELIVRLLFSEGFTTQARVALGDNGDENTAERRLTCSFWLPESGHFWGGEGVITACRSPVSATSVFFRMLALTGVGWSGAIFRTIIARSAYALL